MGAGSKDEVYQKFLGFYDKAFVSGNLSPCTGEDQVRQGRDFLDSVPTSCQRFQLLDFYRLAQDFIGPKPRQEPRDAFRVLGKAFEVLELISVSLYLWPWRKEIKSIKTFTGAFVYFIQPVFPHDVLQGILEKMGYTQKGASEYVMSKQVNKEEVGQLGFEFFLARAECEVMQEMLGQATQSGCGEIVQIRSRLPLNQADCVKRLNATATGAATPGEGDALGNEGLRSADHRPAEPESPSAPLPLADVKREETLGLRAAPPEDGESEAAIDPLSTSRLPPDSIDLYSEYTDIAIATDLVYPEALAQKLSEAGCPGGELEQGNSLLVLDESLMRKAQAESLVKLSPGKTGPLSLSPFSNSTVVATSSENKNPKNKDWEALDQKCPLKPGLLDAPSQKYPEDNWSGKSYQLLDSVSSLKYAGFMNGNANSRKKGYVSAVEIELKNIEADKLPYPIAETAGPALFHHTDHFRAPDSQCVRLSHPEPPAAKPLQNQQSLAGPQLSACRPSSVPECCVCSPAELLGGRPLLDHPHLAANSTQESGGKIVREPPQSFYIPPGSMEGKAPSAMSCNTCGTPICPNCNSELTAGQCQTLTTECLQIQEVGDTTDTYLYVSKLKGRKVDLGEGESIRCNRCKKGGGL
ncbi:uncharacterized protein si:ch211-189a15.5 [Heptranchias perlo]|uniref:uncharacterized protein si:ch211-189a15.5 n=1 Tax=Heptranchias perlo TaxID=212740 RepID=UPI003559F250